MSENQTTVKSVNEFIIALNQIQKNKQSEATEFFFRGQSNFEWTMQPGVFRDDGHFDNEKNMFNDIITQCPEEFSDCRFTFEYLVKM